MGLALRAVSKWDEVFIGDCRLIYPRHEPSRPSVTTYTSCTGTDVSRISMGGSSCPPNPPWPPCPSTHCVAVSGRVYPRMPFLRVGPPSSQGRPDSRPVGPCLSSRSFFYDDTFTLLRTRLGPVLFYPDGLPGLHTDCTSESSLTQSHRLSRRCPVPHPSVEYSVRFLKTRIDSCSLFSPE